jgi:serine/threonine protein kinase
MSDECRDLLTKLLERDPKKRLGSINGVTEVMSHKFFEGINTEKLLERALPPLYVPEIKGFEFFDQAAVQSEVKFTMIPESKLKSVKDHESEFYGFGQVC